MLSSVADSLLQPYPEYTSFSDIICAFHFAIQLKSVEVTRFKELVSVIPEILEKMDLKNTSGLVSIVKVGMFITDLHTPF